MIQTTNLHLDKYEANDPTSYLVVHNSNMDKIDTAVGSQNDAIELISSTASTAVSTANTASTTANTALTTANSKASIDDLVSSSNTTYSSDKIDDLISGIQPGTEIDDSVTSSTKTWSSSKINTAVSSKASINDITASATTTYSSNKIDSLVSYDNIATYYSNETQPSNSYNYDHDITINDDGFYIINSNVNGIVSDSSSTYPAKLITNGECGINLNRNNLSYNVASDNKLFSVDFTNAVTHARVNDHNIIMFKNTVSLFLKAGDVINIKNYASSFDIVQTWKFTSDVKIYRLY